MFLYVRLDLSIFSRTNDITNDLHLTLSKEISFLIKSNVV